MGRRKNFCDWCIDEDEIMVDTPGSCHYISINRRPISHSILISSGAIHEQTEEYVELITEIEWNYCPVCGAKIHE